MSKLFKTLNIQEGDHDELIKQNMLKRFKEIQQDHEKEFIRLNVKLVIFCKIKRFFWFRVL